MSAPPRTQSGAVRLREIRTAARSSSNTGVSSNSGRRGFTLVEMLVVLSIMVVVAGISVPIFLSARIGTRRTNAENAVRAALASARMAAIERRTTVAIEIDSTAGTMTIYDWTAPSRWNGGSGIADRRIGARVTLPQGIVFDNPSGTRRSDGALIGFEYLTSIQYGWIDDPLDETQPFDSINYPLPEIAYLADGSIANQQVVYIGLLDTTENNGKGWPLAELFGLLPATGLVVEVKHCEDPTQPESPSNVSATGWL